MSDGKSAREPMSPFGRRRLTNDEEHLWSLVARTVRPLRESKKPVTAARHKAGIREASRPANKRALIVPEAAALHRHTMLPPPPTAIMRREKQQLARGRTAIDARIDLHGMTQAAAHGALQKFLHRSQANGAKFVLVITGKGAPNGRSERGVLRQQVPLWLALPEFRRYVLGFDVAHKGHGGEGALYVRLRRGRG